MGLSGVPSFKDEEAGKVFFALEGMCPHSPTYWIRFELIGGRVRAYALRAKKKNASEPVKFSLPLR
jgi:hypothetical protein